MEDSRTIKLKHRILAWVYARPRVIRLFLSGLRVFLRLGRVPLLWRFHPFLKPRNNQLMNLPINRAIQPESVPLPPVVLKELITRTRHLHVLDLCPCRKGNGCRNHPHDLGCLLLGETGLDVVPQMSRPVTQDEAFAHVDRAIRSGLVPMIARMRADNYLFLTPDRHTLIAACFCCHCCCGLSSCRLVQPAKLRDIFHKPEGLEIEVSDRCIGCGTCIGTCYMEAIRIENGRALHGEHCLGCGRCAGTCPGGAVDIRLTDPAYLGKTVERYLSLVKID